MELIDDALCAIFEHLDFRTVVQKHLTLVCKQWQRILNRQDFGYIIFNPNLAVGRIAHTMFTPAIMIKYAHKVEWAHLPYNGPLFETGVSQPNAQVDWHVLCRDHRLSEKFIILHANKLGWTSISHSQKLSIDFMERHVDKVHWRTISRYQTLNSAFILRYAEKLDWKLMYKYQSLDDDVLIICANHINWRKIMKYENLSENVLSQCAAHIGWHKISSLTYLSEEFITEYAHKIYWSILPHKCEWSEVFLARHADWINWSLITNDRRTPLSDEFTMLHTSYMQAYQSSRYAIDMRDRYCERFVDQPGSGNWYDSRSIFYINGLSSAFRKRHELSKGKTSTAPSENEHECLADCLMLYEEVKCRAINLLGIDWKIVSRCVNLTEEFVESHADQMDWHDVFKFGGYFSAEFIARHNAKTSWKVITKYQLPSLDLITQYRYMPSIRWNTVCNRSDITVEFIEQNAEYLCWYTVTSRPEISEEFIERYASRIFWDVLVKRRQLSEELLTRHSHRINWNLVSQHQHLSEEFMILHEDRINWEIASRFQKLSEDLVNYYADRVCWNSVEAYQNLNSNFLIRHSARLSSSLKVEIL